MSDDFEEIGETFEDIASPQKNKPDSLFDVIGLVKKTPWKLSIFVFLIFIFVSSDLFVEWVLARIDGATITAAPTAKGTFIQGFMIVLGLVIIDLLISSEIL